MRRGDGLRLEAQTHMLRAEFLHNLHVPLPTQATWTATFPSAICDLVTLAACLLGPYWVLAAMLMYAHLWISLDPPPNQLAPNTIRLPAKRSHVLMQAHPDCAFIDSRSGLINQACHAYRYENMHMHP